MTPAEVIADGLTVTVAALTLLGAGHGDAAARVLVAGDRATDPVVDLVRDGRTLRVLVREVTP